MMEISPWRIISSSLICQKCIYGRKPNHPLLTPLDASNEHVGELPASAEKLCQVLSSAQTRHAQNCPLQNILHPVTPCVVVVVGLTILCNDDAFHSGFYSGFQKRVQLWHGFRCFNILVSGIFIDTIDVSVCKHILVLITYVYTYKCKVIYMDSLFSVIAIHFNE